MKKQQETMRIFRAINSALGRIDKMNPAERKMTTESLIAINERMADFVINLLNQIEDAREPEKVYQ